MTSDTMKVDWTQSLEVVYDNGDVFTPDENHGNYASWVDGDGDRCRHFFEDDGRSNVGACFRIRNKPAAAVVPVAGGDEEWGPAIEVGGVRPAWIDNSDWDKVRAVCFDGDIQPPDDNTNPDMDDWCWDDIKTIQLPASHSYYAQILSPAPAEAPLGVLTGVESLGRYEGFLRRLATGQVGNAEAVAEAKALLPIDPDLLKAREIAANHYGLAQKDGPYITGANDDFPAVRIALAGIKAGREMGK